MQKQHIGFVPITLLAVALAVLAGLLAMSMRSAVAAQKEVAEQISMADPYDPISGRSAPSGGYEAAANSLTLSVDNTIDDPDPDADTLHTEGLGKPLADSSAISAKLTVDADWQGKDMRAGFWGVVYSPNHEGPGWPFIEFTTIGEDDFTGFRVYDTRGGVTQKWYNLTDVDFEWGQDYTLKIAFNATTEEYDFFVDNEKVLSLAASRGGGAPRGIFRSMLFTTYNSITGDATDDYSATFTDATRYYLVDAPVVVDLENAEDGNKVTLTTPAGTTITDSATMEVADDHSDGDLKYPLGLVSFSFATEHVENPVTLVFVTDLKPNQVMARKYNPTTNEYREIEGATIASTQLDGQNALSVSYTIADNGVLDLDPVVGQITDPIGLAELPGAPNTGLAQTSGLTFILAGAGGVILLAAGVAALRNRA